MTDLDRCKAFFKQHGYIEFFDHRESGLWKRTKNPSWSDDVEYRVPSDFRVALALIATAGSRIRKLEARVAELEEKQRWRDDMENAPHNCSVLLGWRDWRDGSWCMEVGAASTGRRVGDSSSVSWHGSATHWMRRPEPPEKPND